MREEGEVLGWERGPQCEEDGYQNTDFETDNGLDLGHIRQLSVFHLIIALSFCTVSSFEPGGLSGESWGIGKELEGEIGWEEGNGRHEDLD